MTGVPADALVLRPMTPEDAGPVGELAASRGRNVGAADYARFLALEGARGVVLTREGALLGAATAMRYFEHAFLGPVVLREDADGPAIALLAHLIETMQRDGVLVLEAEATSAAEEPILARMGFRRVRWTVVMERAAGERGAPAGSVPMRADHLLDVGVLDADAVGYGRKQYIETLRREIPDAARVLESEGEVAGYALLRRTPRGYALGPIVTRAEDVDAASALVRDALLGVAGEQIVALVPEGSPLVAALAREGFADVGTLSRMRAGEREAAPQGATEWVVGSRLTG